MRRFDRIGLLAPLTMPPTPAMSVATTPSIVITRRTVRNVVTVPSLHQNAWRTTGPGGGGDCGIGIGGLVFTPVRRSGMRNRLRTVRTSAVSMSILSRAVRGPTVV
jgi:hypothetical protein